MKRKSAMTDSRLNAVLPGMGIASKITEMGITAGTALRMRDTEII